MSFELDQEEKMATQWVAPTEKNNKIVKPKNNEVFLLRKNIPLELQKIFLKSQQPTTWKINGKKIEGQKNFLQLDPKVGNYIVEIEGGEKINFSVTKEVN